MTKVLLVWQLVTSEQDGPAVPPRARLTSLWCHTRGLSSRPTLPTQSGGPYRPHDDDAARASWEASGGVAWIAWVDQLPVPPSTVTVAITGLWFETWGSGYFPSTSRAQLRHSWITALLASVQTWSTW